MYTYVDKNNSYLHENSMISLNYPTAPCTKHECLALTSKLIRKFNPTDWDQHFLKLILHIQHRLNLA